MDTRDNKLRANVVRIAYNRPYLWDGTTEEERPALLRAMPVTVAMSTKEKTLILIRSLKTFGFDVKVNPDMDWSSDMLRRNSMERERQGRRSEGGDGPTHRRRRV